MSEEFEQDKNTLQTLNMPVNGELRCQVQANGWYSPLSVIAAL